MNSPKKGDGAGSAGLRGAARSGGRSPAGARGELQSARVLDYIGRESCMVPIIRESIAI